jgi:hypothetical protein
MLTNFINLCICNSSNDELSVIKIENKKLNKEEPYSLKNKKENSIISSNIPNESNQQSLSLTPSKINTTLSPLIFNNLNHESMIEKNFSYKLLNERMKKKFGTSKQYINEQAVLEDFKNKVDNIINQVLIKKTISESEDSEMLLDA